MAAVPEASTSRCVLWFGEPLANERSAMAAAGWYVRRIHPDPAMAIGLRGRDRLLAVLDLRHLDTPALQLLAPWIEQHVHLPWLAVLPPGAGPTPAAWLPLLQRCISRFTLPFGLQDLVAAMRQQFDADDPSASEVCAGRGPRTLIGESPALHAVRTVLHKFAPVELPVLVTGETGTGKELVARQLHAASGRRGRFVALNCGAISESLLEAELFGYSDGAFTGARRGGRVGLVEAADGGTLFLDEIGELPLPLQTRLLRVLEEREVLRVGATEPTAVDVRVVAATLKSLEQHAATGGFRRDLYYRLAALRIALPPLRVRRSDIPLLAQHFFRQLRGIDAPLDEAAMAMLTAAEWPGNVRELRNLVDRLRIHWQPGEGLIDAARLLQLAPELVKESATMLPLESNGKRPPRAQLETLLQDHRNDREGMAQALGVSRTTLWRWLRAEGL